MRKVLPEENAEFMKQRIIRTLLSVKREGMDKLVSYLVNNTDYFIAPSSTRFHGSFKYGLMWHCDILCDLLLKKRNEFHLDLSDDTIYICAYLHDITKTGLYLYSEEKDIIEYDKVAIKKGHGVVSVNRISHFIKLTPEEHAMIKFHMGVANAVVDWKKEFSIEEFSEASDKSPFISIFHATDQEATIYEGFLEKELLEKTTTQLDEQSFLYAVDLYEKKNDMKGADICEMEKYFHISSTNPFSQSEKFEKILKFLTKQGDIFQIKPGYLKILK